MTVETGTYISDFDPTKPNGAVDSVSEGDDHINIIKQWIQNTWPNVDGEVTPTVTEFNYLVGLTDNIQDQIDAVSGGGPGNSVIGDFTANNGSFYSIYDTGTSASYQVYNTINGGFKVENTAGGDFQVRKLTSGGGNSNFLIRENGTSLEFYDPSNGVNTVSVGPFGLSVPSPFGASFGGPVSFSGDIVMNASINFNGSTHYMDYRTVTGGGQGIKIGSNGSAIDFTTGGSGIWYSGLNNMPGGLIMWGANIDMQSGTILNESDERLKENITDLGDCLSLVNSLSPVRFDYIDGPKERVGLIAQEAQGVLPNIVHEGDNGYLSIAYGDLVPYLLKAVQELSAKVAELEGK